MKLVGPLYEAGSLPVATHGRVMVHSLWRSASGAGQLLWLPAAGLAHSLRIAFPNQCLPCVTVPCTRVYKATD